MDEFYDQLNNEVPIENGADPEPHRRLFEEAVSSLARISKYEAFADKLRELNLENPDYARFFAIEPDDDGRFSLGVCVLTESPYPLYYLEIRYDSLPTRTRPSADPSSPTGWMT